MRGALRRVLLHAALVLSACLFPSVGLGAGELEAPVAEDRAQADRATVEGFHVTLIQVMQTPGYLAREALVAPAIADVFDIPRIARVSVGRTWDELDEGQRETFTASLERLVVATYASRFNNFDNQRFETEGTKVVRSGVVVSTNLVKSDGSLVSLDYALRDGRVFNVVADGVSDLSLRRADYNSIIKTHGFERLLEHIEEKIAEARDDS